MRKPWCQKQDTHKGAWSKQEDQKLIEYIRKNGEGCWNSLAQAAGLLRCGKSCRLRWINYLRPDLKRGNFDEDEEDLIIKLHSLLGNRWSLIAGRLPGRTDNEVKNYWNSHLRRKLLQMGIDPNNHKLNKTTPSCHLPTVKRSISANSSTAKSLQGWSDQVVSDDRNCVADVQTCRLIPDLNLNLNIPLEGYYMEEEDEEEEEENPNYKSKKSRDIQMDVAHNSSNTLLLFR